MADINYYKCGSCGKYTRHISITDRELAAITGECAFVRMSAALSDYIGMRSVLSALDLCAHFKCCECGQITNRKLNGDVRATLLYGNVWLWHENKK